MNKELTIALYRAINTADPPRPIDNWHASSIAKCPRALFLERMGVLPLPSNEPGGGKKLRWRAGHAIEATIRPELEKVFPDLVTNVRFTNFELDLTGEFDAYDPTSKILISVKSVHDFAMITRDNVTGLKEANGTNAKGQNSWKVKQTPYTHHEWQEHSYVLLMNDPHTVVSVSPETVKDGDVVVPFAPWEVEKVIYIYITLGGMITCYTTEVKPAIVERVKAKLKYLHECWLSQTLPVCLCQEGQEMYLVQDQYCSFKTEGGCCSVSLLKGVSYEV